MFKKVLITGARGFIGKNITENLSEKYSFLTPSHVDLELTDEKAALNYFQNHSVDVVIHCANIGGTRKSTNNNIVETNLRMFFNLTRCQNYYSKMIFIGSGAEYDKRDSLVKVKESDFGKSVPVDDYGFYKYVCSSFIEKTDNIVNLRLFGIYGKYEDYEIRFISNSICKMLLGLPISMNQNVFFDYLYIKDFVKILDYFISNRPKYKFYNVGSGKRIDLYTIAKKILKIGKKKLPIKIGKTGLNNEYTCNISRLREEIPNFKYTNIDIVIKKLIEYYHSILPSIKKEDLTKYD